MNVHMALLALIIIASAITALAVVAGFIILTGVFAVRAVIRFFVGMGLNW